MILGYALIFHMDLFMQLGIKVTGLDCTCTIERCHSLKTWPKENIIKDCTYKLYYKQGPLQNHKRGPHNLSISLFLYVAQSLSFNFCM